MTAVFSKDLKGVEKKHISYLGDKFSTDVIFSQMQALLSGLDGAVGGWRWGSECLHGEDNCSAPNGPSQRGKGKTSRLGLLLSW